MGKKAFSGIMLTLLLLSMLTLLFNVQPAKASGTIYIRADGSVEPPTAPISSVDNVTYTFTADIYDSIVVDRNNIVVDGADYTVQGTGSGTGIDLSYRSNVTLKNVEVTNFNNGIHLESSSNNTLTGNTASSNNDKGILLERSSNNVLAGNTASNNWAGIWLYSSSYNTLTGNTASSNNYNGITLYSSSYNTLTGNTASSNQDRGISLISSSNNNVLTGNTVSLNNYAGISISFSSNDNVITDNIISLNSWYGISIGDSSNNIIYRNNFVDNAQQVYSDGSTNVWDNGVEGNYWSDYEERYPDAEEINGSGIWDTPYVIDANNQDNYPIPEFPTWTLMLFMLIVLTVAIVIYKRRLLKTPIQ